MLYEVITITDSLDLLAGLRYTKDEKSGSYVIGDADSNLTSQGFDYDDDNVSYLLGVNYSISDSIMAYAKYSTAFVSGGSVAGFGFDPEEVRITSYNVCYTKLLRNAMGSIPDGVRSCVHGRTARLGYAPQYALSWSLLVQPCLSGRRNHGTGQPARPALAEDQLRRDSRLLLQIRLFERLLSCTASGHWESVLQLLQLCRDSYNFV